MIEVIQRADRRGSIPIHQVRPITDIGVPMRDGTRLSLDLYLPVAAGPFPTVLIRTPYDNSVPYYVDQAKFWSERGYACAIQDVRGRFDSLGPYYQWHNEAADGFDTQEWVGAQEWCNGSIGTIGASHDGATQWLSAPLQSRFLKAMIPSVTQSDIWHEGHYSGGAFALALSTWGGVMYRARSRGAADVHDWRSLWWSLPLVEIAEKAGLQGSAYRDWVEHDAYDDYWRKLSLYDKWPDVSVPVLNEAGWFDAYPGAASLAYTGVSRQSRSAHARSSQRLLIGPWPHNLAASRRTGQLDFGPASMVDLREPEVRFFDHWVKGIENGLEAEAPVRLFVMGTNEWRDEPDWPLARATEHRLFLHSRGGAARFHSDGLLDPEPPDSEPADAYSYDPANPVITWGGNHSLHHPDVTLGPYDQRMIEGREDVLTYTTGVLQAATEVTGPVQLVLFASSSALDTDFTGRLVDVHPDGAAMSVCDGVLRARYRDSWSEPTLMVPGDVYKLTIDLGVTSHVFGPGHRIRVDISSSNFPRIDRNLNTGRHNGFETEMLVAHQAVHHSARHPSCLSLPVIPPA
jgi:putative CocE/NonD family hydrolase